MVNGTLDVVYTEYYYICKLYILCDDEGRSLRKYILDKVNKASGEEVQCLDDLEKRPIKNYDIARNHAYIDANNIYVLTKKEDSSENRDNNLVMITSGYKRDKDGDEQVKRIIEEDVPSARVLITSQTDCKRGKSRRNLSDVVTTVYTGMRRGYGFGVGKH